MRVLNLPATLVSVVDDALHQSFNGKPYMKCRVEFEEVTHMNNLISLSSTVIYAERYYLTEFNLVIVPNLNPFWEFIPQARKKIEKMRR
jgi:hypothetical protein